MAGVGTPMVEVAVGLVRDARGRVLLARRRAAAHLGGRVEFPGGKLRPGETPVQALARELAEEVGVRVIAARRWLRVTYDYPAQGDHAARHVRLYGFVVTRWRGAARAREGQPLLWATLAELAALDWPQANAPFLAALHLPPVYQISGPCAPGEEEAFLRRLRFGLDAGVKLVCLRCPGLPDSAYGALAARAVALAAGRAQVLLHDRPELLAATGAAGVHLSARSLAGRRERPSGQWVGASCHDAAELAAARALGADFAVLGPVRPTASHPGAAPLGWARFAALCAEAGLPVYALGGLTPARARQARRLGGQGVAVLGALWPAGGSV